MCGAGTLCCVVRLVLCSPGCMLFSTVGGGWCMERVVCECVICHVLCAVC